MNETQNMIAESAKRLFSASVDKKLLESSESGEWPDALWREVETSGFTSVLVPEALGGISGRWADAFPLLSAVGYYSVPLPIAETAIASNLIARAALEVPNGPISLFQSSDDQPLSTEIEDGQLRLTGQARSVPWANAARAIAIVTLHDGKPLLALVTAEADGMTVESGKTVSLEARDHIIFDRCATSTWAYLTDDLDPEAVLVSGALARAVMMVGACEFLLDQTVSYANDRSQFGRPIGKFQAIQHSLALLAGEVTSAKTAALAACDSEELNRFRVAVAKIRAGIASGACASISHQVHGAIGFTYEHSLHYATRRLWSWRGEYGADTLWAREIGRQAIERGGNNLWTYLTAQMSM